MATVTVYHLGGFNPAAPQQNRAEQYDGAAGTYSSWDTAGVQTSTRPLTAAEIAQLAAIDTANTAGTNQATLQTQAQTALANNRAFIAATKPGTAAAQASAAYDQAVAYGRQLNGVIRLLLNQFDATN